MEITACADADRSDPCDIAADQPPSPRLTGSLNSWLILDGQGLNTSLHNMVIRMGPEKVSMRRTSRTRESYSMI